MKALGQLFPVNFLNDDRIKNIFKLLGKSMFVGGCVRDCLLGTKECFDIDIATESLPMDTIRILEEAGYKVIVTGLKHGTVTVVLPPFNLEITTLRIDKNTDGRHADVEFSSSWKQDALRRDFTINALYADLNGVVYDAFNGESFKDLNRRKVKFIGFAEDRIKEDYLRILRYFRFYSKFLGSPSRDALIACRKNASNIKKLSKERVLSEFRKILLSSSPETVIKLMDSSDVLKEVIPCHVNVDFLRQITWLEEHGIVFDEVKPTFLRRFIALLGSDVKNIKEVSNELKMTNKEKSEFSNILKAMEVKNPKECKYLYGFETALSAILLNWAKSRACNPKIDSKASEEWYQKINDVIKFKVPKRPLSGDDLIKKGLKPSDEFHNILKKADILFVNSNFTMTKQELWEKIKD